MQSFAWLAPLAIRFPFASRVSLAFREFAIERVIARKKNGSVNKDLFYHLVRRAPFSVFIAHLSTNPDR